MKRGLLAIALLFLISGVWQSEYASDGDITASLLTGSNSFYLKSGGAIGGSAYVSNSLTVGLNFTNVGELHVQSAAFLGNDVYIQGGNLIMSNHDINLVGNIQFNSIVTGKHL